MNKPLNLLYCMSMALILSACSNDDNDHNNAQAPKKHIPVDIRSISAGPDNTLWVSIADDANPRVSILDTTNNTLIDEIETTYNPTNVVFTDQSKATFSIINTVASDYTDSEIELVNLAAGVKNGPLVSSPANIANGLSDYNVAAYEKNYYRIGRYNIDLISKYDVDAPDVSIFEYSTLDSNETITTSNPYQLVFVSESKAYLIRYNSPKIWIVNPSAASQPDFKIGEIDLSDYNDVDGSPEISDGVIVGDKLYVTIQGQSYYSVIEGNSYVAVIDTTTEAEIDTNPAKNGLKGIQLKTNNPLAITYNDKAGLFVQSVGDYGNYPEYIPVHNGGIEKISTTDYSTKIIVDDGDESKHPYGLISNLVIISDTIGYFVGYAAYGDNSLHQFNPTTGAVVDGVIAGMGE